MRANSNFPSHIEHKFKHLTCHSFLQLDFAVHCPDVAEYILQAEAIRFEKEAYNAAKDEVRYIPIMRCVINNEDSNARIAAAVGAQNSVPSKLRSPQPPLSARATRFLRKRKSANDFEPI